MKAMAARADKAGDATPSEPALDYEIIEQLFFAYRDFTAIPMSSWKSAASAGPSPRPALCRSRTRHDGGRSPGYAQHHQAEPGAGVEAVDRRQYIHQVAGPEDRRQRSSTPRWEGKALARALAEPQSRRIAEALARSGPGARETVIRFLNAMRNSEHG